MPNPFAEIYEAHQSTPEAERMAAVTEAIGEVIPFVKTAGCEIAAYTPSRVAVRLADREAVHNHIGTLHAAALALLAETASGLVVAVNLTPPAVPLLRSMALDFQRVSDGAVTAEATLPDDEAARLRERPIGKLTVPLRLTDTTGREPVDGTLQWAWVPEGRMGR